MERPTPGPADDPTEGDTPGSIGLDDSQQDFLAVSFALSTGCGPFIDLGASDREQVRQWSQPARS